ncbi:MAG: hypothetical protein HKN76_17585 [Saprospiraceae bacterium]|nr:hypothetical protein [Saprospiraceae bacterium]
MKETDRLQSKLIFALVASLTLGLAPFLPEPHLIGKLRWLWGGGHGMQVADYFDLVMHGAPWLFLVYYLIKWGFRKVNSRSEFKSRD